MGFSGLTPVGATARPEQRATRACRRAIAGSATVLGLMGRQLSLGSAPHPECQQTLAQLTVKLEQAAMDLEEFLQFSRQRGVRDHVDTWG